MMNYMQFCATVTALLTNKPPHTGILCGGGANVLSDDGKVLAVPMNADGTFGTMADAYDTDSSAWADGAWDGMTPAQIECALSSPVYQSIEKGSDPLPEPLTIDMTPTWVELMPLLVHVAIEGDTAEGRKSAMGELMRLAAAVDAKKGKSALHAAAPKLLDALRNAVAMIDNLNSAYGSEEVNAVAQAGRDAITEATRITK